MVLLYLLLFFKCNFYVFLFLLILYASFGYNDYLMILFKIWKCRKGSNWFLGIYISLRANNHPQLYSWKWKNVPVSKYAWTCVGVHVHTVFCMFCHDSWVYLCIPTGGGEVGSGSRVRLPHREGEADRAELCSNALSNPALRLRGPGLERLLLVHHPRRWQSGGEEGHWVLSTHLLVWNLQ